MYVSCRLGTGGMCCINCWFIVPTITVGLPKSHPKDYMASLARPLTKPCKYNFLTAAQWGFSNHELKATVPVCPLCRITIKSILIDFG